MPGLSNRTALSRAAAIAYQLDPEAAMGKIRGSVKDRHVTLRPAPDTMSRLPCSPQRTRPAPPETLEDADRSWPITSSAR